METTSLFSICWQMPWSETLLSYAMAGRAALTYSGPPSTTSVRCSYDNLLILPRTGLPEFCQMPWFTSQLKCALVCLDSITPPWYFMYKTHGIVSSWIVNSDGVWLRGCLQLCLPMCKYHTMPLICNLLTLCTHTVRMRYWPSVYNKTLYWQLILSLKSSIYFSFYRGFTPSHWLFTWFERFSFSPEIFTLAKRHFEKKKPFPVLFF